MGVQWRHQAHRQILRVVANATDAVWRPGSPCAEVTHTREISTSHSNAGRRRACSCVRCGDGPLPPSRATLGGDQGCRRPARISLAAHLVDALLTAGPREACRAVRSVRPRSCPHAHAVRCGGPQGVAHDAPRAFAGGRTAENPTQGHAPASPPLPPAAGPAAHWLHADPRVTLTGVGSVGGDAARCGHALKAPPRSVAVTPEGAGLGARRGTRTLTPSRAADFESAASANSAIRAW